MKSEEYEIICVYTENSVGIRNSICLTWKGPSGDMASYDYTPSRGFHKHPIINGKKQKQHVILSGNINEFAQEIVKQLQN